jgi:molybdenum cofactor cytidylyltransferase
MRAQDVDVKASRGRILYSTLFRRGGKKLLAKGHIISAEDVSVLESHGMEKIRVTQLEEGEVSEDFAVSAVAREMGCGSYEIHPAAGGRANLVATESCCVLVDDELLKQINCTASVVTATLPNFSYARAGQRIATVKSAPFAVDSEQLEAIVGILKERGPILQARPIRTPVVGVLYTDSEGGESAHHVFEGLMQQRLARVEVESHQALFCKEDENSASRSLQQLLRSNPSVILVASPTTPAGPDDAIGRAMLRVGGQVERFLAPVEPGNLFLMAYKDEVPVVSAPGCFRSARPNIVDLVLPPLLARYRLTGWEVAGLGHGGLLG